MNKFNFKLVEQDIIMMYIKFLQDIQKEMR